MLRRSMSKGNKNLPFRPCAYNRVGVDGKKKVQESLVRPMEDTGGGLNPTKRNSRPSIVKTARKKLHSSQQLIYSSLLVPTSFRDQLQVLI